MAVPVQNPVASFTANGVTTVFPYAYLLLSADDLQVTLDGVVLTAGFTVSGVGSVVGGNVTFSVAPVSGTLILRRKMSLSRLVDYVEAGDLLAATLNLDLDRIWMVLQGLEADSSRSIKLPEETLTAQEITEDAATRASKLLGFDVAGNVATMDLFDPAALIVTAYIESLLAAGSASTARAVLAAAADADVVKLAGAQTVAGVKTFSAEPVVPVATVSTAPVRKAQLDAETTARGVAIAAAVLPATIAPTLLVAGTAIPTTSGTTIDLSTVVPIWARRLTVVLDKVSLSSTSSILVQIGDSGGFETADYVASSLRATGTGGGMVTSTAGFIINLTAAVVAVSGHAVIVHVGSNTWVASHSAGSDTLGIVGGGSKTLSGALDRIRITTVSGTDTFDAGQVSLLWE